MLSSLKEAAPNCKVYFAASNEMFGKVVETPQPETTPFYPRSPYGISKVAGFYLTRKITSADARIYKGLANELQLGNLDAKRDWDYAPDYVTAMWLMLQQPEANHYVVATGETHSVREFVECAFSPVGLDWQNYVVINPHLYRPAEVNLLCGDSAKARRNLGWEPKVDFEELVQIMVESDIRALEKQPTL